MNTTPPFRTLLILWVAWAAILLGFQSLAEARLHPQRPDLALEWTRTETMASSQSDKPYLLDPFMNEQVSWDSEFYLSIAIRGYDDPTIRKTPPSRGPQMPLSYAFYPLYPYTMRAVAWPLRALGLVTAPIATATLAGVIVSLLGTLGAMIALYDLAREELDESGALRAAFYLLIFPSGFFLAQVYTEGLFVGLAFGSLALARRKKLAWAALLAALATWTRAVGIGLVIPLALAWWSEFRAARQGAGGIPWRAAARGLLVLAPWVAFLAWKQVYGQQFEFVEHAFFSRGLFLWQASWSNWSKAFQSLWGSNPQAASYYAVEFAAIVLGLGACLALLRRYPGPALFGLFVVIVSLTSGPAQGMHRYVLGAAPIFLLLARWGKNQVFDRAWTLGSTLVMGLFAMMYTYDMWAG